MIEITRKVKKSIKQDDGKKLKKNGEYTLTLYSPEELDSESKRLKVVSFDVEAFTKLCADMDEEDICKWVDYGRLAFARITFSNMLGGTDRELNAALKQFEASVVSVVKYTGEDVGKVREKLLADPDNKRVKAYFDSFASGEKIRFDESQLGEPGFFTVGQEDSDESDESDSDDDSDDE